MLSPVSVPRFCLSRLYKLLLSCDKRVSRYHDTVGGDDSPGLAELRQAPQALNLPHSPSSAKVCVSPTCLLLFIILETSWERRLLLMSMAVGGSKDPILATLSVLLSSFLPSFCSFPQNI